RAESTASLPFIACAGEGRAARAVSMVETGAVRRPDQGRSRFVVASGLTAWFCLPPVALRSQSAARVGRRRDGGRPLGQDRGRSFLSPVQHPAGVPLPHWSSVNPTFSVTCQCATFPFSRWPRISCTEHPRRLCRG